MHEYPASRMCHDTVERMLPDVLVFDSAYLLRDRKEVLIRHGGEVYRLRLTKKGKLILNK